MLMTWALTVVGLFCILAFEKWQFEKEPHYIVGIVAVVLCLVQPVMAAFRPGPTAPNRVIFNWAHWGVGNAAHVLAGGSFEEGSFFSSSRWKFTRGMGAFFACGW